MNQQVFERGMKLLAATWPDRSPTSQTTAAYWMALSHLDDTTFGESVTRCLRECTFFPRPAEILERAEAALTTAGLLPEDAETVWNRVAEVARSWHPAKGPTTWINEDIDRALRDVGGFRTVALSDDNDVRFIRKDFLARYSAYRQRRIAADQALMGQALPASTGEPALMLPTAYQRKASA